MEPESVQRRLAVTARHLSGGDQHLIPNSVGGNNDKLRWNGWGYSDTEFTFLESGDCVLTGTRYPAAGQLPHVKGWIETELGIDAKVVAPSGPIPKSLNPPVENKPLFDGLKGNCLRISFDNMDRLHHSHGHTAMEVYQLRYGWPKENRLVDVVVWPGTYEDVVAIVKLCNEHDACIIPYGGGTSVTYGLIPPKEEKRTIVSVDMHEMNKIKWVDKSNMTACIEAGIPGKVLQERLEAMGFTMGHEPDSAEFSTLGGWISTRASGMKKNKYGNIEDILISARMVTPTGLFTKDLNAPRISAGPDINESLNLKIMLGSEGTYGIITDAIVRIQPLPNCQIFGAIIFPNFEQGVKFMRAVAYHRTQPASIRLVDNEQFKFSHALKPKSDSLFATIMDQVKKLYVTGYHKIDVNQLSACTLVFEGSTEVVNAQQSKVYSLAKEFGGIKADATNGKRGYELTYMIAYLRDFGFQIGMISESFETSVPWSNALTLCAQVKERVKKVARDLLVPGEPFTSCRVTQTYDTGCCIYFYVAIPFQGVPDPVTTFCALEHAAREEIIACGGSISHHHGVGKHRKDFLPGTIGETGMKTLVAVKKSLDPTNIFASNNLIDI